MHTVSKVIRRHDGFRKGSGCFKCESCGTTTRKTRAFVKGEDKKVSKLTKEDFLASLRKAIEEFEATANELEAGNSDIREWNDEFMLALYEHTRDTRRA